MTCQLCSRTPNAGTESVSNNMPRVHGAQQRATVMLRPLTPRPRSSSVAFPFWNSALTLRMERPSMAH